MLKPVSTNTLIFDGKIEKFELFEDPIHTMLKMQPEMTEAMKINHFHAHLRKEALQTFRNMSALNMKTLDDVLIVFRRKYVKPESQATAKHKWHKLTFDPNTKSLPDFLEELNECAERAFGDNAQHMIDSLLYAKLPPHLKRSLNLAYLENGTYDQIVAHLERELELSSLENDGDLTIPTMTAVPPNDIQQKNEQIKVICHYCKKPGHVIRECRKRMRKEQEQRNDPSNQNIKPSTSKSFPPCPHCQRTNHPPEKCWSGPNAANRPKRFEQEYPEDNRNGGQDQGKLTHSGPSSILKKSFKLKKPRLQWSSYTSVRQYVISDPSPKVYHSHQTLNTGIPSVVWQQQMEKAYTRRYNNMHIIQKTLPTYEYDYTDNFDTHFRPLPEVVAYDPYFVDPQYGFDPYWDEEIYDPDKLEYKDTYNKPNDQIGTDDLITDAPVSEALRYAVIDLWTVNPQLPDTSPLPNFRPRPQKQQRQTAVIDDQVLPQLQVTPDGLTRFFSALNKYTIEK